LANSESNKIDAIGHGRSIWIGEQAVIDVASRAVTGVDSLGRVYGQVRNGGQIIVGGDVNPDTGIAKASDLFVVVREGAPGCIRYSSPIGHTGAGPRQRGQQWRQHCLRFQ
jgi:hypothetical protein